MKKIFFFLMLNLILCTKIHLQRVTLIFKMVMHVTLGFQLQKKLRSFHTS